MPKLNGAEVPLASFAENEPLFLIGGGECRMAREMFAAVSRLKEIGTDGDVADTAVVALFFRRECVDRCNRAGMCLANLVEDPLSEAADVFSIAANIGKDCQDI